MNHDGIFAERARTRTTFQRLKLAVVESMKDFHLVQHLYSFLENGLMLQYYRKQLVIHHP